MDRRRRAGSALLIVLAFVVLLTGLILAFFSRSILEQQVSVSSANQVKVDGYAMAAVSATVSDLKQEMEEGSYSATNPINFPVSSNNYIYYYSPILSATSPTSGMYPTMVPAVTGSTDGLPSGGSSSLFSGIQLGTGSYVNLIKVSLHNQAFYPSAPWDNSQLIPKRVPLTLPVSTGISSDSTAALATGSASGTSLNGRYVSGARWNKPLFLPTGTVFPMPDWIYSFRSQATALGNPTVWNANLISAPGNMSTTTTVVGRYAYAIYDEGALLDINVAGAPTNTPAVGTAYKNPLSMADLTQIGLTQAQIDTIVGWRNNASATYSQNAGSTAAPTGSVSSGYTWSTANGTNYFMNVITNPTGFLRPMSVWSTVPTGLTQTDQFFTSRQQLIQFFTQVLGGTTTVLNTLQYLTHFSRDLNQPSYIPPSIGTGGKPATAAISSGGNDLGGGDATVNPAFLSARVTIAYTRNDGSAANVGDPLVKKRFALSRLAWLTYLGPISTDAGTYNTAPGISALVTTLKTYGYTDAFLRRGGPTNIYKYFGLAWLTDTRATVGDNQSKWYYNHESLTAPTTISSTAAHIRTLCTGSATVTSQARDADFFELLKAGTCLGSVGKAYGTSTSATTNFNSSNPDPIAYQAQLDNSTDRSIIQMGANSIDQFQPTGYAERILFYDGTFSYALEVRGVEDLPYFYRVRQSQIMVADASPTPQASLPSTSATETSYGTGVVMYQPEIWNPHAYNTSNPDTNPRPTSFRVVAIGNSPNAVSGTGTSAATAITAAPGWRWYSANPILDVDSTAVTATLNEANTAMTFSIPTGDLNLFREPTLLMKPGIPTNSGLASVGATITSSLSAAQFSQNGVTDNKKYIGFIVATLPMAWSGNVQAQGIDGTNPTTTKPGVIPTGFVDYTGGPYGITYRMQYQDASGNWVTYDEKYAEPFQSESWNTPTGGYIGANKTFGPESAGATIADCIIGAYGSYVSVDPRTSRFGMIYNGTNGRGLTAMAFPLGCTVNLPAQTTMNYYSGWAAPVGSAANSSAMSSAAQQSAVWTVRPDEYRGGVFSTYDGVSLGFGSNTGPTGGTAPQNTGTLLTAYGGWYPIPTIASTTGYGFGSSAILEPGLLVQNNPTVSNATSPIRFGNDTSGQNPPSVFNHFYADADGVVRRGMAAYVPVTSGANSPATAPSSSSQPSGLPTKEMMDFTQSPPAPNTSTNEYQSRPIMLNRPFRSVADLDYVFSDAPWKNIDMSTPESGCAGLLDVFCLNETEDPNGLIAGKVNLNTRQIPVLTSILNGAYTDEFNPTAASGNAVPLSSAYATDIATALVNRTQGTAAGLGPLRNISDLVGKWKASSTTNSSPSVNGGSSFVGFTSDSINSTNTSTAMYDLTEALTLATGSSDNANTRIERFRDASIRALANAGQTRVWNLMIDIIAQTGRFPTGSTALTNFNVEGEQRYWVHLAIDRYTGQIIDQQVEEVKE